MIRAVAIALLLSSAVFAADPDESQTYYRWSLAAVAGSQAADIASSWGGTEANPLLGAGQTFGAKQAAAKCGVIAGAQATAWWFTRRHPKARRLLANINFGVSGATTAVAIRNWSGK